MALDSLDYMAARNDMIQALLAEARSYKITHLHECLPGCDRTSAISERGSVTLSPEQGPTCRILYRKANRFLQAGSQYPERGFIAANRIGKTETAAFELRCHLTGRYPDWWEGRRWSRPTDWRAAGYTMLTTRDILQTALLGPHEGVPVQQWNGMIEGKYVQAVTRKSGGIPNCVDTFYVEHVSGGISRCSFLL